MTAAAHDDRGLDDLGPDALLDALAAEDLARRVAERNILRLVHQWAVLRTSPTADERPFDLYVEF